MYVCETEFYMDVKAECIRVCADENMYLKGVPHIKRNHGSDIVKRRLRLCFSVHFLKSEASKHL